MATVTPLHRGQPTESTQLPSTSNPPKISLRSLLQVVLLAAGVCIVTAGLRAASSILAPVVGALFLALIITAPIPWLKQHMSGRWAAFATAVGAAVGIAVLAFAAPYWSSDLVTLMGTYRPQVDKIVTVGLALGLEYGFLEQADLSTSQLPVKWVFGASQFAASMLLSVMSALLFTGFILLELAGASRKLSRAFDSQPRRKEMMRRVAKRLSVYFRVKTLLSAVTGVAIGLGCWALSVPTPVLWGLLAFALNFVPNVGSVIAAVPAVMLSFLAQGWQHALLVLALFAVVNGIVGALVEPKILGQRMGLSPLVILLSLVFWGWVWGPVGLLLAVPMSMVAKIVVDETEGLKPLSVLLSASAPTES